MAYEVVKVQAYSEFVPAKNACRATFRDTETGEVGYVTWKAGSPKELQIVQSEMSTYELASVHRTRDADLGIECIFVAIEKFVAA